jgi:hypothetical protein
VVRPKAKDIAQRRNVEPEDDAIDAGDGTDDLIHFQDLAIAQTDAAHLVDRAFPSRRLPRD